MTYTIDVTERNHNIQIVVPRYDVMKHVSTKQCTVTREKRDVVTFKQYTNVSDERNGGSVLHLIERARQIRVIVEMRVIPVNWVWIVIRHHVFAQRGVTETGSAIRDVPT